MLAACVPALKPLVSKVLKLSEYGTNPNSASHFGSQFASRYGTGRSRSRPWQSDQYALEELQSNDDGKRSDEIRITDKEPNYSATAAFYNGPNDESYSHSEETDLGNHQRRHDNHHGNGNIVLTTEVIVH